MIPATTRDAVRRRAGARCEYCRLPQAAEPGARFHIEHIVARQHGGADDEANLALACHRCNRHKGPNLSGIDPVSARPMLLFHPRRESWEEHFRMEPLEIIGLTATGRMTVALLQMNAPVRVALRRWNAG
jgi:hypothetical protein